MKKDACTFCHSSDKKQTSFIFHMLCHDAAGQIIHITEIFPRVLRLLQVLPRRAVPHERQEHE